MVVRQLGRRAGLARSAKDLSRDEAFEERKKKHEEKWAHDETLRFKANARRNKLVGLWAAGELGLVGEAAETYAKAVVTAEFHNPGADNVFAKLRADFDAAGIKHPDALIRRKIDELLDLARHQILNDAPGKS
jgi:hypothetical protein